MRTMKIVSLDGVVVDRREGSRRIVPPLALGRIFGRRRLRHLPVLLCSLDHLLCGHYCGATFAPAGSQASLNRLVDRVNALDVPQLLHQSRFWLNKRQRAGEALLESALCNSRGARPAGRMPWLILLVDVARVHMPARDAHVSPGTLDRLAGAFPVVEGVTFSGKPLQHARLHARVPRGGGADSQRIRTGKEAEEGDGRVQHLEPS
mmetsp:Transcript_2243/g.5602  ORF Transcript_2243/g.5602 Transcript_2243/m.5602 type:complete len:206 (-) Transcript_2243:37-654(-)